ncbi:hypothetical protein K443DRAFT_100681 [Laccaria amethystina LaAM-08-1]|uniref:Uncharacterized protein n=1 Tax=Laccaria amethystina LaAM-08-1 TaxID=1095629 RepID=A0A0C9X5E9_9AGAR|nr:hypothetical protein K443DRAFT_100681 [Laccaria amethystina LaAM-08-1]
MRCSIFTALVVAIAVSLTSSSPIPTGADEVLGAREAEARSAPPCTPFTCI